MKVVIVGAGKLGQKLAESLVADNFDVTIIDNDEYLIENINENMDILSVVASGVDINVLKEIGIENYDFLIACTKEDEINTVACLLAKKLGCKKTVARLRNPEYLEQISFVQKELGIDYIINPEFETAKQIERYLMKNYNFYIDDFAYGQVKMLDFNIGHHSDFINKEIKSLSNFDKYVIVAISRNGELIIPSGQTKLLENDVIHVIGKSKDIAKLDNKFHSDSLVLNKTIEDVMILGGGRISYYLAKLLTKYNIALTIIEEDERRCEYLDESLDNVLVIHGDGTDVHLLEEENLNQMDAFIGLTGYDEQNLLMALIAKQAGVNKTIAKISRDSYIKIINNLGIDVSFNTVYITASKILKFIRGSKVNSVSLLLGGEGEVTEIIVDDKAAYVNKPLAALNLPSGIIIGAIVTNDEVIIPKGNSIIRANDKLVVFSLTKDLASLNNFTKAHKEGLVNEIWDHLKSNR